MSTRRLSAVIALPAAFALAACSSSGSAKPDPASSQAGQSGSGGSQTKSSAPASSSAAHTEAQQLAALLQNGVKNIRTAHLSLDLSAAGQRIAGDGDEKVENGKVQALQITENLPGKVQIRIVYVGGKTYAKLPKSVSKSTKPYVLVTKTSSNPAIRGIASSIDASLQSASVDSAAVFVRAASSVKKVGNESVNGTSTTHYSVVVDTQKLPANLPGKQTLAASGIKSIPVEIFVDNQGRPVQITQKLTVAGKSTSTKVTISKYNQPVKISAPPASQVQTG